MVYLQCGNLQIYSWEDSSPLAFHNFVYKFGEERSNIFIHENATLFEVTGGVQWDHIDLLDQPQRWTAYGKDRPVIPDIKMMHQSVSTSYRMWCTVFLLMNLKAPEWIYVDCREPIKDIRTCVCSLENKTTPSASQEKTGCSVKVCPKGMLKINSHCVKSIWTQQQEASQAKYMYHRLQLTHQSLKHESTLQNILKYTLQITPILCCHFANCTSASYYHLDKFRHMYIVKQNSKYHAGFLLFQMPQIQVTHGSNIILCHSGSFISVLKFCSEYNKCAFETHKKLCTCSETESKQKCCPSLLYKTKEGQCVNFDTSGESQKETATQLSGHESKSYFFKCTRGLILPGVLVDDLVPDCGTKGEDESILKGLIINNTKRHCIDRNQLPCYPGHTLCFDIHNVCVFQLDKYLHTVPCRNAAHLHNCTYFECDALFKCPGFYCIHWKYVCNKRWDCPKGTDETENICHFVKACQGMFRCQHFCIHLASLCDGVADCLHAEDELLCQLSKVPCPDRCSCLAFAIMCENAFLNFPSPVSFVHISVQHSPGTQPQIFNRLPHLISAHLLNMSLGQACNIFPAGNLQVLLLMFDNVPHIEDNCFKTNKMLFALLFKFQSNKNNK